MQTNSALTLYRKSVTSNNEVWTRTAIARVHWENRKAANVTASGLLEADSVNIWVPLSGQETATVYPGDVLVKGTVTDVVNHNTFTMTDLRNKYPGSVVTARTVDRYDFGSKAMQHIKVGAS